MNYCRVLILLFVIIVLTYSALNIWHLFHKGTGKECWLMGGVLFWSIVLFPVLDCEISIQYTVPMGSAYSQIYLITCTIAKIIVVWLETKYQIDNEKEISFYERKISWLSLMLIFIIMEMYSSAEWLPQSKMYDSAEWIIFVNLAFIWYYYLKNARKGCNEKNKQD